MKTILLQLDTDIQPSVFDRIVAVDAGVEQLFSYGNITPENVEPLVHGVMFTRGGEHLKNSAIFIGGSNVLAGERLFNTVQKTFFNSVRCSVMHDSNGCNTTASAAVLTAKKHLQLKNKQALVLGGTGPVGVRIVELLATEGAHVAVASRTLQKANNICESLAQKNPEWNKLLTPCSLEEKTTEENSATHWLAQTKLIIAAGAAGIQFYQQENWNHNTLEVAIDLNAVPPEGLQGITPIDKAVEVNGTICYGAMGVGGLKMKIHKAALQSLFNRNNALLDTNAIYKLGKEV